MSESKQEEQRIGQTISKLRTNENLTQDDLAHALNVSRQLVSKWESGEALPGLYLCRKARPPKSRYRNALALLRKHYMLNNNVDFRLLFVFTR